MERLWRVLIKKKWRGNRGKRFYKNMWGGPCTSLDGEGLVKVSWDFPFITVLWKLLNTFRGIFSACLTGFCLKNDLWAYVVVKYTQYEYTIKIIYNRIYTMNI